MKTLSKILLVLFLLTSLSNASIFSDIKSNIICTAIKFIPKNLILSSQKIVNNKLTLPKKINEDMEITKITLDKNRSSIIYNVKCSEYVDDMYIKIYLDKLTKALDKMKAIQCIFDKGIKYKYVFYRNQNGHRKVLAIKYFPY